MMLQSPTAPTAEVLLRDVGLRVTGMRITALDALASMPHSTVDAVFEVLRAQHPGTSIQATYNVLGDLHQAGLLRRIEPAGSAARFERRIDDNHHHVVCRSCGEVSDVDCAVGAAPCLTPSNNHGFILDEAEVVFWGLCPSCQNRSHASTI